MIISVMFVSGSQGMTHIEKENPLNHSAFMNDNGYRYLKRA